MTPILTSSDVLMTVLYMMTLTQVPQDQLEPVLRCASQLRIKGLENEFSRESSLEPDRPASQQSGSSKRKTSPKFHFLKNRRKNLMPSKLEEVKTEDAVQDDEEEMEKVRCGANSPVEQDGDGPVDFTIKADQVCSSPETVQDKDLPDMAAFFASASAAVRNVSHFQVRSCAEISDTGILLIYLLPAE